MLITGVFILLIQACKPEPFVLEPIIFKNTQIVMRTLPANADDPQRLFKYIAALGNRKGPFKTIFIGHGPSENWCHKIESTMDPITPCDAGWDRGAIHVSQMVEFAADSGANDRKNFLEALELCPTFPNCP